MSTTVSDWQIVSATDYDDLVGKVLWGTFVDDMTFRFVTGDYICTSKIMEIPNNTGLIKTDSRSLYQIVGNSFSPRMINQLNMAPNVYF
tara:strand:- start:3209 stop:3475 length:267 start_codon:yes stop_codon:yes gene_type:complete